MLCDRLGIIVDGQLVCIGNPKELTSRYGEYYVSPKGFPAAATCDVFIVLILADGHAQLM